MKCSNDIKQCSITNQTAFVICYITTVTHHTSSKFTTTPNTPNTSKYSITLQHCSTLSFRKGGATATPLNWLTFAFGTGRASGSVQKAAGGTAGTAAVLPGDLSRRLVFKAVELLLGSWHSMRLIGTLATNDCNFDSRKPKLTKQIYCEIDLATTLRRPYYSATHSKWPFAKPWCLTSRPLTAHGRWRNGCWIRPRWSSTSFVMVYAVFVPSKQNLSAYRLIGSFLGQWQVE